MFNNINEQDIIDNPAWQEEKYKQTLAMYLATENYIPPIQFNHNPNIQDVNNNTVAIYLAVKGTIPPQQWEHKSDLQNNRDNTVAILLANKGIIPPKQWEHEPEIQNKYGDTVAIKLAQHKILPPEQWYHNPNITNTSGYTVQKYLEQNNIEVPEQWKVVNKQIQMTDEIKYLLNKYCKKYYIKDQQTIINYPQYQKKKGNWTFAMCLAFNGIIPPKEFEHKPNLQVNNQTVAMLLEINNIETPQQWRYDPEYRLKNGKTTAITLAYCEGIYSKHWQHDPNILYKNVLTVAYILSLNKQIPSQEWQVDPNIIYEYQINKNFFKQTVALQLAQNKIIPPKEWHHDPNITDICGFTVQDYLQSNNIEVPDEWQTEQKIKNKIILKNLINYCQEYNINMNEIINNPSWQYNKNKFDSNRTFAMYLVKNRIMPPKQFIHDPNIKGNYWLDKTVRQLLQEKEFPIPNEWYDDEYKKNNEYKPQYLNDAIYGIITDKPDSIKVEQKYDNGYTIAMIYAKQGIVPPECWNHDPEIQNDKNCTVAMLLSDKGIIPPVQWNHNPTIQNENKQTVAILLAQNGIIPQKEWEHKSELQDCYKYTVAMYLAQNKIIPPKQWQHDPQLQNNYNDTVAILLAQNNIIPPKEWYYKEKFEQKYTFKTVALLLAKHGTIPPKEWTHFPELNMYGYTVAMLLVYNKIFDIPKYWYHDPLLYSEHHQTIAILYAKNGQLPPKQWEHDPNIVDSCDKTVAEYLLQNNIQIPQQWKIINKEIQMTDEIQKQLNIFCKTLKINQQLVVINYPYYYKYNYTFALWLAKKGIIPPEQFQHDPLLVDRYKNTVAMLLTNKGFVPPKQWYHDPLLTNIFGSTVAIILSSKGIIPPQQWMHDINITNNENESIRSNLYQYGYVYNNNEFIDIKQNNITQYIQTETLDDICQICLNEGQQGFVKTNCTHRICIQCFQEMIKVNSYKKCPICRQYDWFNITDKESYQYHLNNRFYFL